MIPTPILTLHLPGLPTVVLYWYGIFLLTGAIAVILTARTIAHDEPELSRYIVPLSVLCMVATVVGGRLGAFALGATSDLLGRRGFVSAAGLGLGALTGYILALRWNLPALRLADIFAPAVALGEAVTRIGTLFAGTGYGVPTTLPWGVVFTHALAPARPLNVPLHPTQVYLAIGLAIVGAASLFLGKRWPGRGAGVAGYSVGAGVVRMLVETMRGDRIPIAFSFTVEQAVSLCFVAFGIAVWHASRARAGESAHAL